MANLITALAVSGCRKSDGTPCASGFVFLYQPGTTISVPGYRDDALTQTWPTTNGGIQLDAGGRAAIWVGQRVDVVVTDASGTQVEALLGFNGTTANAVEVQNAGYTGAITDQVTGAVSQGAGGLTDLDTILSGAHASFGGLDFSYLDSPNAVPIPVFSAIRALGINVKSYGALGNGRDDDTLAIQKAINIAISLGGCPVVFPIGTYKISSLLQVPASSVGMAMIGFGAYILQTTGVGSLSVGQGSQGFVLQGLGFTTQGVASGGGVAFTDPNRLVIDTVSIGQNGTGPAVGLTLASVSGGGFGVSVRNSLIEGATTAISVATVGGVNIQGSNLETAAGGSDQAILFSGGAYGAYVAGTFFSATTGIKWSSVSGVGFTIMGCPSLGSGFPTTPMALSGISGDPGIVQYGNQLDNKVFTISPDGSTHYTPNSFYRQNVFNATATTGAAIINGVTTSPTPACDGKEFYLGFYNSTGSSITWTLDSSYHVSAAISTTAGNKTLVGFKWDGANALWREFTRAVTT